MSIEEKIKNAKVSNWLDDVRIEEILIANHFKINLKLATRKTEHFTFTLVLNSNELVVKLVPLNRAYNTTDLQAMEKELREFRNLNYILEGLNK